MFHDRQGCRFGLECKGRGRPVGGLPDTHGVGLDGVADRLNEVAIRADDEDRVLSERGRPRRSDVGRRRRSGDAPIVRRRGLHDLPFGRREHLEGRARAEVPAHRLDDPVERGIAAQRIVVADRQAPDAGQPADPHDVLDGAVAPADLPRVFLGRVLAVVDD